MNFGKDAEGKYAVLIAGAAWKNYGDPEPRILPEGTVVRLESFRPEGFMAEVCETGETFFISRKYIERAVSLYPGEETIIRQQCCPREMECQFCGNGVPEFTARWYYVDRGTRCSILCPDCAAVLLAESSRMDFRTTELANDRAGVFQQ